MVEIIRNIHTLDNGGPFVGWFDVGGIVIAFVPEGARQCPGKTEAEAYELAERISSNYPDFLFNIGG